MLVSFELRPRVILYDPKGRWLGEEKIPALLKDVRNYRDSNKALEAVSVHSRWGVLVGTELPLRNEPAGRVRIFAGDGRSWLYPLSDVPSSSLVAFEALPEGGLLTLERAFVAPFLPFVISLRRTEPLLPGMEAPLKVTDVAVFNSSQGWHLDNFEGLTHYRDRRFFMVSDDNCSFPFRRLCWSTSSCCRFLLSRVPPLCSHFPGREVFLLLGGECIYFHVHRIEFQPCDFPVNGEREPGRPFCQVSCVPWPRTPQTRPDWQSSCP